VNWKIKTIFIALIFFCIAQKIFADETHFREGVAAYEAGQYNFAAQSFDVSLAEKTTAQTLLNLGLADWRREQNGEAMVAWQRAAWLDPFDQNVRKNLLFARETASVNALDLAWYEQASAWLPANWWTVIMSCSLWSMVALTTLPAFFRSRKANWQQNFMAVALGIFLLSLAPSVGIFTRAQIGMVIAKTAPLRLTPTQTAETIAILPAGEPVRKLRRRGDYFFVRTQNGDGWVERRQIEFLVPQPR
jgi:tetratricopeptide (TPR) repeat protein